MINNVIDLLPESLREQPLYLKLVEIVDRILSDRLVEYEDVYYKFRDIRELDSTALENMIREFGYGYILDVLDLTYDETVAFSGFLYLVHTLKGHRLGLELVLRLLRITDYELTEWWEKNPAGTPDTFDFGAFFSLEDFTYAQIITIDENLQEFFRDYVYPIPDTWVVGTYASVFSSVPKVGAATVMGERISIYPL